jgi:hypothetical protein
MATLLQVSFAAIAAIALASHSVRALARDAFAPPASVQAAKDYLEGVWLVGKPADKGSCLLNWYDGATQLEFEFQKSAGRLVVFEPYDLFQQIQIAKVEIDGDRLALYARARDGTYGFFQRVLLVSADQIEIFTNQDAKSAASWAEGKRTTAFRCGVPNRTVNETVSMEDLSLLTPVITGAATLPEAIEGVADKDLCDGNWWAPGLKGRSDIRSMQFDLLGPVHYWAIWNGFGEPKRRLEFDYIRSIQRTAPGVLKLKMQEHVGISSGWDAPSAKGETYEITVIWSDGRIRIPELDITLVHCDPPLRGKHRSGQ